jgi:hypothetical protein
LTTSLVGRTALMLALTVEVTIFDDEEGVMGGIKGAVVRVPKIGCPEIGVVVSVEVVVLLGYGGDMVNVRAVLSFETGDDRVMVAVAIAEVVVTVRV